MGKRLEDTKIKKYVGLQAEYVDFFVLNTTYGHPQDHKMYIFFGEMLLSGKMSTFEPKLLDKCVKEVNILSLAHFRHISP